MSILISFGANKSLTIEPSAERSVNIVLTRSSGVVTSSDQIIYNNTTVKAALDDLYANQGSGGSGGTGTDYMDILILG
jgi:hypothetical protein